LDSVHAYAASGTTKKISKIGLGTWQFGSREWGYGDRLRAPDPPASSGGPWTSGSPCSNTAEIYAWGSSERLLGAALGEESASAFIATKIFPLLPVSGVVQQRRWPAPPGSGSAASTSTRCTSRIR
jgi:aryl-alcohol dehydrogenase-like predicted oxidoreductase